MITVEQAINDIVKQLEAAWNRYDSSGYAAPFRDDAVFIQIFGGELDGRPAIEASHRHIFDTIYRGSHLEMTVRHIRFLRPDVAIAFAHAHLKFFEAGESRELDARPTLILAQEQGRWQIQAFQNTRVSAMPAAAVAASRLAT